MGAASFDLSKLGEDGVQEGIETKVLKDGKERGELRFDVSFYPVLKPQIVDGKEEELPETSSYTIILFLCRRSSIRCKQRSELCVLLYTRPRISTQANLCPET